jgi:hypothetical protein
MFHAIHFKRPHTIESWLQLLSLCQFGAHILHSTVANLEPDNECIRELLDERENSSPIAKMERIKVYQRSKPIHEPPEPTTNVSNLHPCVGFPSFEN